MTTAEALRLYPLVRKALENPHESPTDPDVLALADRGPGWGWWDANHAVAGVVERVLAAAYYELMKPASGLSSSPAPTTIVNFYIECADQGMLENYLLQGRYPFVDSTAHDPLTRDRAAREMFPTLADIEAQLEGK